MILENNRKKVIAFRIVLGIIVIAILISSIIYFINIDFSKSKKTNDTKNPIISTPKEEEPTIFKIKSILLYSSANALNNSETQKDYWNLNIFQYTDMSFYIDNYAYSDKLTSKNLVKSLYIDNVNFSVKPVLGTPGLFYKNPNSLGVPIVGDLDNKITDKVEFTVNTDNESVDYTKPSFYADCSNPLTLSYVNEGVYPSLVIKNNSDIVTFDGSLLQKSGTVLNNIKATVNFTIHLINAQDEEYTCNISLPITLSDDTSSIYDGHFVQELNTLGDEYNFVKVSK